ANAIPVFVEPDRAAKTTSSTDNDAADDDTQVLVFGVAALLAVVATFNAILVVRAKTEEPQQCSSTSDAMCDKYEDRPYDDVDDPDPETESYEPVEVGDPSGTTEIPMHRFV
ncbi:hypothetical protein BaRGS_00024918, partial [Batillaria attramentaria]